MSKSRNEIMEEMLRLCPKDMEANLRREFMLEQRRLKQSAVVSIIEARNLGFEVGSLVRQKESPMDYGEVIGYNFESANPYPQGGQLPVCVYFKATTSVRACSVTDLILVKRKRMPGAVSVKLATWDDNEPRKISPKRARLLRRRGEYVKHFGPEDGWCPETLIHGHGYYWYPSFTHHQKFVCPLCGSTHWGTSQHRDSKDSPVYDVGRCHGCSKYTWRRDTEDEKCFKWVHITDEGWRSRARQTA